MRVLGLDISKDAIACIEVETAFGRFEIRETHETPVASGPEFPEHHSLAVAGQLLQDLGYTPHELITSLPAELSTFRNLRLATKDKKAIRSALEFELEDDLPFEREDLHFDSVILDGAQQGSLIHIGATKKKTFETYLSTMLANHLDPDVVTTDSWAYRTLFTRIQKNTGKLDSNEPVLLLGFDKSKTFFYVHFKGRPILHREIPFGLKSLERKLNESIGASSEELRSWIHDIGVSGIDEQVSNAIMDSLKVLVQEMKQTELAVMSLEKMPFGKIYVTGEGALMPGFLEWLGSASERQVELFKPLTLLAGPKVSYSDITEVRFSKALALAMCAIPSDKIPPLNLRKKDFAKSNLNSNSPLDLIKKPLPYLLILLLVFFVTKSIEYNYYKGKLSESEESLKKGVKTYFGGISDNAARTYLSDRAKLKKTIEKDLTRERELSRLFTPNPNSPLDFLKNLSQKIGRDVVLDLVSFDSGSENTDKFVENKPLRTRLTFVVATPESLAKLSENLEKNFGFKKGASEELTREGRKVYKISFAGTLGALR
jgi:Tfp pilus assembly PilM family ATPase